MDCCLKAPLPIFKFEPVSPKISLWDTKLQLMRCPACGALWGWRQTSVGHQDWDDSVFRVNDQNDFERVRVEEERLMHERLAELKKRYEAEGREWKW
jgi:hypothetical protein